MSKLITDKLLVKYPEMVDHLKDYINRKSIKGKPIMRLNGSRCWTFTGHVDPAGYGIVFTSNKEILKGVPFRGLAHRVSYMVFNGETNGLNVLHHCDNSACVCPDHLYVGTQDDNGKNASDRFAFAHPTNKSWKLSFLTKRIMKTLFGSYTLSEIATALNLSYNTVYYYYNKWCLK